MHPELIRNISGGGHNSLNCKILPDVEQLILCALQVTAPALHEYRIILWHCIYHLLWRQLRRDQMTRNCNMGGWLPNKTKL
jgi:hypothetical protein